MSEKPDQPSDGGGQPPGGNGQPPGGNGQPPGGNGEPPGNGGGMDGGGMDGGGGGMEPHPQLGWEDAQRQMLRGMTQPEKTAYFQMDPSQQDAMVQDWHQQNFGMSTSTDMPHT